MNGYAGVLKEKYAGINDQVTATRVATVQVPYVETPEGYAPRQATIFFEEINTARGF